MITHRTFIHVSAGVVLSTATMLVLLLLLLRPGLGALDLSTDTLGLAQTSATLAATPAKFAAAGQNESDAIVMTLTVGMNQANCAATKAVTTTNGFYVVYCFSVENRSNVTWTHFMVSDESSDINFPLTFTLTPPQGLTSTFYFTAAAPALGSAIKVLSLQATNNSDATAIATDTVQLIVPAIQVTHTVGTDAATCATTKSIDVVAGTAVTHCYKVENLSEVTLLVHDIQNSQLGIVAQHWPFVLEPGATVQLTETEIVSVTASSVVTWTANVSDGLYAIATDSATVRVPALSAAATVDDVGDDCASSEIFSATVGDLVYYCYRAINLGGIALQKLIVIDSVSAEQIVLTPTLTLMEGDVAVVQVSYPLTQTVVNTVTWQAQTLAGVVVTATATAYANPLARLNAAAFYDVDRDRVQVWSEYAVPSVTINLASANLASQSSQTDQEGFTTFAALPTALYTLTVSTANMAKEYFVPEADMVQLLAIDAPGVYSVTIPLTMSNETDSDQDSIPDYLDGTDDDDEDGTANYLDPDIYLRLPFIMR